MVNRTHRSMAQGPKNTGRRTGTKPRANTTPQAKPSYQQERENRNHVCLVEKKKKLGPGSKTVALVVPISGHRSDALPRCRSRVVGCGAMTLSKVACAVLMEIWLRSNLEPHIVSSQMSMAVTGSAKAHFLRKEKHHDKHTDHCRSNWRQSDRCTTGPHLAAMAPAIALVAFLHEFTAHD